MSIDLDAVKKRWKDVAEYAYVPRPRHYFKFSAPTLNYLASGGRDLRGIRSGALIEFVGAKSCGKSTLALDVVANAQAQGKDCFWFDIERWFDPVEVGKYAENLGVNINKLLLVRPKSTEQAFNLALEIIEEGAGVVVIDSVAAAIPQDSWNKNMDDPNKLGESAKLVGEFARKATILADDSNTLVLMLNQIRANISTMSHKTTKRYGGRAYEHHLHQAYELTVTEHKDADKWKNVQVFLEKNRIGGEERLKGDLIVSYGRGFRVDLDVFNFALRLGIVQQINKSWYEYDGKKYNGKDNAAREMPISKIRKELEQYYDRV